MNAGLPTDTSFVWTTNGSVFSDSMCGHPTSPSQDGICWFTHHVVSQPSSQVFYKQDLFLSKPDIYRVDFDMKFASTSDTVNGCKTFDSTHGYRVYMDLLKSSSTDSYMLSTGNDSIKIIAITDSSSTWKRYSQYSKGEVNKIGWRHNGSYYTGQWGLDNIEIFYNTVGDSSKWICLEKPSYLRFGNSVDTLNVAGTYHYVVTLYKNGISYLDTVAVIVDPILAAVGTITGDSIICYSQTGINSTYSVNFDSTCSYTWGFIGYSSLVGSSTSNSISLMAYHPIGIGQNLFVKIENSCSIKYDTMQIETFNEYNALICYVDCDATSGKNKIYWNKEYNMNADSVYILRLDSTYKVIHTAKYTDGEFIDTLSAPQSHSYYYKIFGKNVCNHVFEGYVVHRTITLVCGYALGTYGFRFNRYMISGTSNISEYYLHGVDSTGVDFILDSISVQPLTSPYGDTNILANYTPSSQYPNFVKFYVSFNAPTCGGFNKSTDHVVKSNIVNKNNIVSVNNIEKVNFSIYPNPVVDKLNINLPSNENMKYEIYNAVNELLVSGYSKGSIIVNTSNLSKGIYFVRIGDTVKKFIK